MVYGATADTDGRLVMMTIKVLFGLVLSWGRGGIVCVTSMTSHLAADDILGWLSIWAEGLKIGPLGASW